MEKKVRKHGYSFYADPDTMKQLKELAREQDITQGELLRRIIKNEVSKKVKK